MIFIKIKSILSGVFVLILIYLFATKGKQINSLIANLGNLSLQSVALLQGRSDVKGVTA